MTPRLPQGWRTAPIGEVCEVISGSTPRRNRSEYWGGDIDWVTPKDLTQLDGAVLREAPEKITLAGFKSCSTNMLPEGSVLFSSRAPIGLVAIAGRPLCTNQGFKSLIPGPAVDSPYLYWCMRFLTPTIQAQGTGTTFAEVSKRVMERIVLPIPPLPEQRRIAAILDKADAIRRKRREAIALTESLLRSTFLDMFGDPVTNPKGWPTMKLGSLIEEARYGPRFHDEPYVDHGTRIVRITDLDRFGRLDFDAMPMHALAEDVLAKYSLAPGDLIFARTGATVGKTALLDDNAPTCVAGAYFIQLRFVSHLEPSYAQAFISSQSIQRLIEVTSRQSAQQNFSGPAIRRLRIPLPPIDDQRQFSSSRRAILAALQRQLEHNAQSDTLFHALVQRAFRGEL